MLLLLKYGMQWRSWLVTALQTGRSGVRFPIVSLEFFRSHYGPGVDSTSNRNEYQEYFLGGKCGRCVRLTTLPLKCANCLEIWEPNLLEPSGPVKACNGFALPLPLLLIYRVHSVANTYIHTETFYQLS
jgi:hypothetical protein